MSRVVRFVVVVVQMDGDSRREMEPEPIQPLQGTPQQRESGGFAAAITVSSVMPLPS